MKNGPDSILSVVHETAKGLRDARIMNEIMVFHHSKRKTVKCVGNCPMELSKYFFVCVLFSILFIFYIENNIYYIYSYLY